MCQQKYKTPKRFEIHQNQKKKVQPMHACKTRFAVHFSILRQTDGWIRYSSTQRSACMPFPLTLWGFPPFPSTVPPLSHVHTTPLAVHSYVFRQPDRQTAGQLNRWINSSIRHSACMRFTPGFATIFQHGTSCMRATFTSSLVRVHLSWKHQSTENINDIREVQCYMRNRIG